MTTLHLIELTCPVCDTLFRSQTVVATNAFGGKRTDFHERAAGMQPLPYFVHLCTHCGYAGVQRDFGDDAHPDDTIRALVWSELAPSLTTQLPSGSLKYEHAAKVAEWQDSDPRYLADLYLRAAWCCVDESDTEAERFFRRKAAGRHGIQFMRLGECGGVVFFNSGPVDGIPPALEVICTAVLVVQVVGMLPNIAA